MMGPDFAHDDAPPNDRPPTSSERLRLQELYEAELGKPHNIAPQLPTLLEEARLARSCAEIGVQRGRSTLALLLGCSGFVIGVDPYATPELVELQTIAGDRFRFWHRKSEEVELPIVDLLFVDGEHTYDAVLGDLCRHAPKVRSRILLHDTTACGYVGARQIGTKEPEWLPGDPGLWPAIEDFLRDHEEKWEFDRELPDGCGLTILRRKR